MDDALVDHIWEAVSDRVGSDLRVVTCYEASTFETRMRPDVREAYSPSEDRVVVNDTIVNQLRLPETEDVFKAGPLRSLVRVFEDAWVLSWRDGGSTKSGVIVSVERDGETATMDDLDWLTRYLSSEVAPRME
ncbi:hypothetical protein [Salinigranum sp.]|uniref:hypothetical protein n=1 Tax=Salinigranum sp. TaxID=1966351 RepID=UPI003569C888